jgi:mono/diheme cytochrome c family protein
MPWGIAAFAGGVVVLAALVAGGAPAQAADLELGKQVYERANCVGCHRWHGGGGGGYGGAALSLRETPLDREMLIEVIRCGRPLTRMPYHDRNAYRNNGCFGMTADDMGSDLPPRAASFLREGEIEAVADYVVEVLQGKGPPTVEDCAAFWGEGARECAAIR